MDLSKITGASIWYTSRAFHRLSIIWKYIYVTFWCDILVHIRKWTILSIHKPKVTQFKFWLHNLVDLIFLFLLIPVLCCLVQFWRSHRLHRESQHRMGNIHIRWGTFTWGREHSHRVSIPKNLAGNNYIFFHLLMISVFRAIDRILFLPSGLVEFSIRRHRSNQSITMWLSKVRWVWEEGWEFLV